MNRCRLALLLLLALGLGACRIEFSYPKHLYRAELETLVGNLAADSLQGREAGTPGGRAAAALVAERMQAIGLQPWASDGYLHPFPAPGGGEYANVCGWLPGKGALASEWVIVSAHYDHIGIQKAVQGDSIANGADDDASGVAAMLVLAQHCMAMQAQWPNCRNLLFIGFDAEEKGLVGSEAFTKAYLGRQLDAQQVVAGINLEMLGKMAAKGKNTAFMTGADRSSLFGMMRPPMQRGGVLLIPDPYPQFKLFYRSDNASLARMGIPAHTISTDAIDRDAYYHTVKDEVSTLLFDNMAAVVRGIAFGLYHVATTAEKPTRVAAE
jgi:hypothetical protein